MEDEEGSADSNQAQIENLETSVDRVTKAIEGLIVRHVDCKPYFFVMHGLVI